MKEYKYEVYDHGELAAGLVGYSDDITITVASGDPGGEPGEFEDYMGKVLSEWFDGAIVILTDNRRRIINIAKEDAKIHQENFPGEVIKGDWDTEAFQAAAVLLELTDKEREELWPIYYCTLYKNVSYLIRGIEPPY